MVPRPRRYEQECKLPTIRAIYDFLVAAPPYYGSNDTRVLRLAGPPPLICDQRYTRARMRAGCDFVVPIPQCASWDTGELRCAGSMMRGCYDFLEPSLLYEEGHTRLCDGGKSRFPLCYGSNDTEGPRWARAAIASERECLGVAPPSNLKVRIHAPSRRDFSPREQKPRFPICFG